MLLAKLVKALEKSEVEYAIVGGVALALHGAPRGTVDIDFVIRHTEKGFIAVEAALKNLGFLPRLPVTAKEIFYFKKEYIQKRNLIAWSFYNPVNPVEVIDIILTHDLSALKSTPKNLNHLKLHVVAIEDLIKMKQLSGRPQDLEDIKMLKKLKS